MIRLTAMSTITFAFGPAFSEVSQEALDMISISDTVETSFGTLEFIDGVSTEAPVASVCNILDRLRGMEVLRSKTDKV